MDLRVKHERGFALTWAWQAKKREIWKKNKPTPEQKRKENEEWEAYEAAILPIAKEAFKQFPDDIPVNLRSDDERMCKFHCFAIFPASSMVHHKYGKKKDACPRCGAVEEYMDVGKVDESDMLFIADRGYTFDQLRRWGYLGIPIPKDATAAWEKRNRKTLQAKRRTRLIEDFIMGRVEEDKLTTSMIREINELQVDQ